MDPRMVGLAEQVGAWSLLWAAILTLVPAGASGRDHVTTLNAAHGVVCTVAAVTTLALGLDSTTSVAASLAYFAVDLVAMVRADGLARLPVLARSRQMDYVHHVLGLGWGLTYYAQEATVCAPATGNPYVWIQTNEVSTPFYNWFRLTGSAVAGVLFALSFFASRVAFNSLVLIPKFATTCDVRYLYATAPYFLLQYAWFLMIARKLVRTLQASKAKKVVESEATTEDAARPPETKKQV